MRIQSIEQFDVPAHLNTTAESISCAHELTVGQVMEAADRGDVALHVPFQIREVSGADGIERVRLFHSEDEAHEIELEVDAILLQLGFKTALGPLKDWAFRSSRGRSPWIR